MKHFLFLIVFLTAQLVSAQSQKNDLSITLGATTIPNFGNQSVGLDLSARYYFSDAFSLGGHFYIASPKFNHGFGYRTDRTLINMYAVNVPLQYDVINTEKFTIGFGFSNGVLFNVLRDRNETEERRYWDSDTGVGSSWNVPQKIKTDVYYLLTPYAEASYKLLSLDKENASMFVTTKVGYQNSFGNGFYSRPNDFRDYVFSLGITIKGATD